MTKTSSKKLNRDGKKRLSIREQQKLMTRERLLDAAVQVFLERGYADATIDEIVSAAEVGRATFYLHFKSKLEVMRDIIQAREDQNKVLIQELRELQTPTHESLEAWLRRFVDHWAAKGDRFLVGLQALASEPELSTQLESGLKLTREILAEWIMQTREISVDEATLRSELLVSSLQRACRTLVSNRDRYDADLVTRVITDIWERNLLRCAPEPSETNVKIPQRK